MVDFTLKIGDRVRSRLDCENVLDLQYAGTITHIAKGINEEGYNGCVGDCLRVTIRRDHGKPGSGFENGWLTLVTEHNKHHISLLEWDLEANYK